MKLEINVKVSEVQTIKATFEAEKLSAALLQANALMSYRGRCECCKKGNVTLQTKMAKEYQFVEFVCGDCGARAQFGAYKKGGCFLKAWEVYQREQADMGPDTQNENIPF